MKRVLLVDDDEIFNFLNQRALESLSFKGEIDSAQNGKQAIDLLLDHAQHGKPMPDLILLDLNMPVMDGFGFLSAFKDLEIPHKEKIKIVVVTSSVNSRDMEKATSLGAQGYLNKPLTKESLEIALKY